MSSKCNNKCAKGPLSQKHSYGGYSIELEKISQIEAATWANREEVLRLGVSILFIVGIILYVSSRGEVSPMLIIAAWIITVPVSGILAAMLFFMIRGMMLP